MKKAISVIIAVIFVFCFVSTFALADVSKGENVDVALAANGSITIDGVMSAGEWDGAAQFTVDKDTTGFADLTDLSVAYNLKWDETYLYICEERTDTDPLKHIVTKEHFMSGQFYQGDATLFFMWFDNGTPPAAPNPDFRDIQYAASSPSEGPLYGIRVAEGDNRALYTNGEIASVVDANKSVIELKFKWSDLPNAAGNIKDGAKIQFYVCDTKTKNDVKEVVVWNDWEAQAYQLIWGKGLGVDVTDWNTMTLKAPASSTPASETATDETVTDENPETGDTSDFGVILLIVASSLGIFTLIYTKNKRIAKEN